MIKLNNVSKIYPGNVVGVKDVYLEVKGGEFVCIVGESGSGKTTLAKLLIAEERPTAGEIEIGGWDITEIKQREIPQLRRQIGVVFQDFKLLKEKTVFENVAFALQVAGSSHKRIKEIVPQVLDVVGLARLHDRYPRQLSGGEAQRVVVARALVHRPKIIVADEPTGNLDTLNSKEIIEILKQINNFGTTVLLVTHNREIVNNLKKRVITLHHGQIAHDETQGRYRI
jgi:cell division transport system ATP-binding protein